MAAMRARSFCYSVFIGLAAALAAVANAADYPARPIRYVVPFAAGGFNDLLARMVSQKLNESWGQSIIVDNRPGAGGNLGADIVAKSTPDGYTIMNISTAHAISQTLYANLNYSLERDLTPAVVLGSTPLIMAVYAGIPAKDVADLVAWTKSNRLLYASSGVGTIAHLSMEMFKTASKIDATHVPYKVFASIISELTTGQVHVWTNELSTLLPFAKTGKLRVLGILAERRHAIIPDVPTFIEQGYKEFVMGNWTGMVAPAGTPNSVLNKLALEVTRIIRMPEVTERLVQLGVDPMGGTPEEFAKLIHVEIARFGKAVKDSGAKLD